MSEQSKKIDILGDILNDSPTGIIRDIEELNKLIHVSPDDRPEKIVLNTQKKRKKGLSGKKHKTTHYLTKEVYDNLGEAKEDIRDYLPNNSKSKATKSWIVESAITVVLNEFEQKGKDSALIRELLKKQEEK